MLYFLLILRLFTLSYKVKDRFGSLIIAGVASMFLFHIFENIGMTIGIMPVTGIPLPFMSYGGSNMLANLAAVGLVLNVVKRQQRTVLSTKPPSYSESKLHGGGFLCQSIERAGGSAESAG